MSGIPKIECVAGRLKHHFQDFSHHNKKNPLSEYIFILLSLTTTEPVYLRTYKSLMSFFPTYSKLLKAPVNMISKSIREGGQYIQKASALKGTLHTLAQAFGRPTLAPLRWMSTQDCEAFLTSLPRIGKKVARCLMVYSFGREVFPVDSHCWRVSCRLGLIDPGKFSPENGADVLQARIPPKLRFSLHVNMVSLGRKFCRAKKPLCPKCPISSLCLKVGVNWTRG